MPDQKDKSLDLIAFMDETGHSDDPNFHFAGMAGFAGPAELWDWMREYWQTVLKMFDLKEPFHMKDFAHSQGQFKDWKGQEEKRKELYGHLVTGIVAVKPIPFGVIISVEDFRSLSPRQQVMLRDPYYIAFQRCTRGVAHLGMHVEPPDKVAMVYSYNKEFGATKPKEVYSADQAGIAEKLWHWMKESWDFGRGMGSYSSSTPGETVQLQAADLFAYELSKEFENLLTRPEDDMRWGLRQILSGADFPHAMISLMDRLELLRIIKESNMRFQEGTEEIPDTEAQTDSARERMIRWLRNRGCLLDDEGPVDSNS